MVGSACSCASAGASCMIGHGVSSVIVCTPIAANLASTNALCATTG